MILMDKMKEQSTAIQPVFGYGGGLGFIMLGQLFNTVPLVTLIEDDDLPEPIIYVPQADTNPFLPGNQQPQQATTGTVANALQQGFAATEQAYQDTGILNQQSQLSVAELVANAVGQHIIAHHTPGETNEEHSAVIEQNLTDTQNPPINVSEMISNNLHLEILANTVDYTTIAITSFPQHATSSNQSQEHFQNNGAAAQPSQQGGTVGTGPYHYLAHIQHITASQSPPSSESSIHNVPQGGESNSPTLPFHASVSSPNHQFFFDHDFPASDDESYVQSVASNIIVIDSTGSSDSDGEIQLNNPDVPNQS